MQDLFEALEHDRRLMKTAVEELSKRGKELARAEAKYQAEKNKRVLQLRDEGMSATLIQLTIKGDRSVNKLLFERDCAQVMYDSAQEALNCYKLDSRLVEAEIERQWNESKRM